MFTSWRVEHGFVGMETPVNRCSTGDDGYLPFVVVDDAPAATWKPFITLDGCIKLRASCCVHVPSACGAHSTGTGHGVHLSIVQAQ